MRQAFMLLGVMTLIVTVGAFVAFNKKAEAPIVLDNLTNDSIMLKITSPEFQDGGLIPSQYTCDGENIHPEFRIEHIPQGTQSLVFVMDDPDIPESIKKDRGIEKFNHWVLYNIPGETTVIGKGEIAGTLGMNSRSEASYRGPCPPDREHRYFFRLYAISGTLNFLKTPTLDEVETAAKSMMIESATIMGRYERIIKENK